MIRIQAKRKKGIRRAGMFHPAEPVEYPDNEFDKKQLKALEDEPLLIVEKIKGQKSEGEGQDPEKPENTKKGK